MKYLIIFSLLSIFIFSSSCKESDSIESELADFWSIHQASDWDSLSTANNLIGNWKLVYQYCCPESLEEETKNVEDENYQLTITSEKIFVYSNGEIIQESNWSLRTQDVELFGIESNPFVSNTFGRILFADDKVLFNGSYIDGVDNYFERVIDPENSISN